MSVRFGFGFVGASRRTIRRPHEVWRAPAFDLPCMHAQSRIAVLEHEVHRLTDISRRVTDELAQVFGWWWFGGLDNGVVWCSTATIIILVLCSSSKFCPRPMLMSACAHLCVCVCVCVCVCLCVWRQSVEERESDRKQMQETMVAMSERMQAEAQQEAQHARSQVGRPKDSIGSSTACPTQRRGLSF